MSQNKSKTIQIDKPFPDTEWFRAVGLAIGASTDVVIALMESWVLLGKTSKQIQDRLSILAKYNGKELIFSNPDMKN